MMEYLHLDEIRVTDHGVREGVLLAYARYGEYWLDHPDVKPGEDKVGKAPSLPKDMQKAGTHEETFVQSGRDELQKY